MCQLCCNPAGEKSCCCFNLSIGLLCIAAYFGVIGGLDIWQALEIAPRPEAQYIGGIVNASIAGYVCLCVLLGFLRLGLIAYLVTMVGFVILLANAVFKVVTFILCWVDWGTGLNDGTLKFQVVMVTSTISQLLTIAVTAGFANLFWSAACVYREGGSGCEYKSYKQLRAEKPSKEAKRAKADDSEV